MALDTWGDLKTAIRRTLSEPTDETSGRFTIEGLLGWANDAKDQLAAVARLSKVSALAFNAGDTFVGLPSDFIELWDAAVEVGGNRSPLRRGRVAVPVDTTNADTPRIRWIQGTSLSFWPKAATAGTVHLLHLYRPADMTTANASAHGLPFGPPDPGQLILRYTVAIAKLEDGDPEYVAWEKRWERGLSEYSVARLRAVPRRMTLQDVWGVYTPDTRPYHPTDFLRGRV